MATEQELKIMLIGKTGHGKSSTGNTLVGWRVFQRNGNSMSETKSVTVGVSNFERYKLFVVDGPGLEDTDMDSLEDKKTATINIEKAVALCYGGVDAFLCVFKFGERFTREEITSVTALKQIIGDDFMKHAIVVLTMGDNFAQEMEQDGCADTFDQWVRKQRGPFRELCNSCNDRVVLINNFERDRNRCQQQVKNIVQLVVTLHANYGRYTSECFQKAERQREKLILEQKAPLLEKEFLEKICLLSTDIIRFDADRSNRNKVHIEARILELREDIKRHDKGFGVLKKLLEQLSILEINLQHGVEMKELTEKIEEIRNDQNTWTTFGQDLIRLGGQFAESCPSAGLISAAIGGITFVTAKSSLGAQEKTLVQERKELEKKRSQNKK